MRINKPNVAGRKIPAARSFSSNRRIASDTMHSLQSIRKIDDPQSFYQANLETVHAIVDRHCRQRGIEKEEWDAIKAELHLLWSENGFKRLRNFRGENSCCRLTYLKTIVASTVIDIVRKEGGCRVRKSQRIVRQVRIPASGFDLYGGKGALLPGKQLLQLLKRLQQISLHIVIECL